MTTYLSATPWRIPTAQGIGTAVVAVLGAASWFAWLGWDQQWQVDPVTGMESGPYEEWQVVGCGVSLVVVFFAALLLRVRPLYASAALSIAFPTAWAYGMIRFYTAQTEGSDPVLIMIMAGVMAGGLAVATAAGSGIAMAIRHGYRSLRRRSLLAA